MKGAPSSENLLSGNQNKIKQDLWNTITFWKKHQLEVSEKLMHLMGTQRENVLRAERIPAGGKAQKKLEGRREGREESKKLVYTLFIEILG